MVELWPNDTEANGYLIGILLTDLFCILSTEAARYGGISALFAVRVLTGLAEVYKSIIE